MCEKSDRHERSKIRGISTRDAVAQTDSEPDLQRLVESLRERPPNSESLFRVASFIYERQQGRIPSDLQYAAADNLADYLSESGDLFDDAARIFIFWGSHRADYGRVCMSLLNHENENVRTTALGLAGIYLKPIEYSHLVKFRSDRAFSEIGMGGPLRYLVRDYALEVLERLTGCPKADGDCFEDTSEGRISYRSWSPFLTWFEQNKAKFRD